MGTCNLHKTGNATTRHVILHEAWLLLLHTYVDSRQKSTGISYWVYGYTGHCITRGMTILYFQLTLYIVGIASGIVRSQLLRWYVQPEPICQPSSCNENFGPLPKPVPLDRFLQPKVVPLANFSPPYEI